MSLRVVLLGFLHCAPLATMACDDMAGAAADAKLTDAAQADASGPDARPVIDAGLSDADFVGMYSVTWFTDSGLPPCTVGDGIPDFTCGDRAEISDGASPRMLSISRLSDGMLWGPFELWYEWVAGLYCTPGWSDGGNAVVELTEYGVKLTFRCTADGPSTAVVDWTGRFDRN